MLGTMRGRGLIRRLILGFLFILPVLALAKSRVFFADSMSSPFLSIALLSVLFILLRTKTDPREIAGVAIISLLLSALDFRILRFPFNWPAVSSILGLASFVVLTLRAIFETTDRRRTALYVLAASTCFVASEWFAGIFLDWGQKASPTTLDLYLFSFDASLGVQPAFEMGKLFAKIPLLATTSILVYIGLPLAIGLAFAGCITKSTAKGFSAFLAFFITGPIGAFFYSLFPGMGPVHVFGAQFPWHPLTMGEAHRILLEPIALSGPRNAIPSLHAAWIYMVYWYVRGLSLAERIGALIFVFFTLCATLGSGEHYLIDLVVAIPFTVGILALVQAICEGNWRTNWVSLAGGLGMVLVWFELLHRANSIFWVSPAIPWALCGVTVAASWFLLRPLHGTAATTLRAVSQPTTIVMAP
jgi:hypothetical protein